MPLSIAPFPEQNFGPLQQALAQSQNQFSQNTAAQIANSQFAQKLDMQAQQAGREETANAMHQAFALAAQTKMNDAKLAMQRETNQTNKEINLLKLAMAQKAMEANQAYRDVQLRSLTQHRETQDAIAQQNADTNAARAAKTKAPSATDKVNANLSEWLGTPPTAPPVSNADVAAITKPKSTTPGPNPIIPPIASDTPPVSTDAKPGAPLADPILKTPDLTVAPTATTAQEDHSPDIVEKAAKTMSDNQLALAHNFVESLKPGETPDKGVVAQWASGIGSANANSGPVSIVINKILADKYKKDAESKTAETEKVTSLKAQVQSDAAHTQQVAQAKTLLPTIQDPTRKAAAEIFVGELEKSKVPVPQKLFDAYFTQPKADNVRDLIIEAAPYRSDLKRLQEEALGIRDKVKLEANKAQQAELQKKINDIEARKNAIVNPAAAAIKATITEETAPKAPSDPYFK